MRVVEAVEKQKKGDQRLSIIQQQVHTGVLMV